MLTTILTVFVSCSIATSLILIVGFIKDLKSSSLADHEVSKPLKQASSKLSGGDYHG
jgi:hypothetical protein